MYKYTIGPADKIELISNKPIVVDEKMQIKFED